MALPGEKEFNVYLPNAAIDTPLAQIKDAIETTMGEPVEFGVDNLSADEDAVGTVLSSPKFIAYGGQAIGEFVLKSKVIRINENPYAYQTEQREECVSADPRHYSKALFLDSEVKKPGDFTRKTVKNLVNIPADQLLTSGIDFGNVSDSQARRFVNAAREQYTAGEWRKALQMSVAASYIGQLIRYAAEKADDDLSGSVVTVSDSNIQRVMREKFATDTHLLGIKSLKRGIISLQQEGRLSAAEHGEQWLSMLEEGLVLDKFTPEVTTEDVLAYPSYLNPHPEKGVPEYGMYAHMVGGSGSRNYTIRYPGGDIYGVDFPFWDARPIKGRENDGFKANVGKSVVPHNKEGEQWLNTFESMIDGYLASEAVNELTQEESSFKESIKFYQEILEEAATLGDTKADKTKITVALAMVKQIALARKFPGKALEFYNYSVQGWGTKWDVEKRTGITFFGSGTPELSKIDHERYINFGKGIHKFALANLAEKYKGHPELSDKIAKVQTKHYLDEPKDITSCRKEVIDAAWTIMADKKVEAALQKSQLAQELLSEIAGASSPNS